MRAGAVLIAVALLGFSAVDASAATSKPAILSLTVTPQTLPSSGGTVLVSARVQNAARCTLASKAVVCASGSVSARLTVAANSSQAPRIIRYVVSATGNGASVQRTVSVTEAALIPPVVITANALPEGTTGTGYSANVVASGGTPPYSWTVVSGALPKGLSLSPSGTITGTPTGATHAVFTVQVTDASPSPQSTTAALSIDVVPPPLAVSRTSFPEGTTGAFYSTTLAATGGTPPYTWSIASGSLPAGLKLTAGGSISGTPTTGGTVSFTVRVTDSAGASASSSVSISVTAPTIPTPSLGQSKNWSGYYLEGSGFTSVSSTFTVPNVSAASTNTDTAEWVGIDGVSNSNLIQAGVSENYSASTNRVSIFAWWEILPAPDTPISLAIVSPSPGDRMTVSIAQQSVGLWSVRVSDDTKGQVFTISLSYNGPLTSAEWIVEAPADLSGNVLTLGQYSPNVVFTNLQYTGAATSSVDVSLVQGGAVVSTPSSLSAAGFSVAFGSSAPSPP